MKLFNKSLPIYIIHLLRAYMKNSFVKNTLFFALMALCNMQTYGMEKEKPLLVSEAESAFKQLSLDTSSYEEDQLAYNPLYIPELRLRIMSSLFSLASVLEPFKDFKACSLVDKVSLSFFTSSEQFTEYFLRFLYKMKYFNDLDLSKLDKISPLLNSTSFACVKNNLSTFTSLANLFTECSNIENVLDQRNQRNNPSEMLPIWWNLALKSLAAFKLRSLNNRAIDFYGIGTYLSHPAKWTLLGWALAHNAPEDIIKSLITYSPSLNELHPTTPSPFLIVFQKLITCYRAYKELHSQEGATSILMKQKMGLRLSFLKERMAMLLEAGASIEIPYKAGERLITSLLCALDSYPEILSYLLEKKPRLNTPLEYEKIVALIRGGSETESLIAYLITRNNDELQPLLRMLIKQGSFSFPSSVSFSPNGTTVLTGDQDGMIREWDAETGSLLQEFKKHAPLEIILDRASALTINALHDGMTLLDIAVSNNVNFKIIDMLCSRGAQGNSITQFTMKHGEELKAGELISQADLLNALHETKKMLLENSPQSSSYEYLLQVSNFTDSLVKLVFSKVVDKTPETREVLQLIAFLQHECYMHLHSY